MREYTQDDPETPPVAFYGLTDTPPLDRTPSQKRPQLDPALWSEVAERARYESPRDLAIAYGVSHETIRTVVRRAHAAGRTLRAMAAA